MHETPAERLRLVRTSRFSEASEAARAMGVPVQTYLAHENGARPLTRSAERYSSFYRVSIDWLLLGKGTMRPSRGQVPLLGLVGAGSAIFPIQEDVAGSPVLDHIDLPDEQHCAALEVRGDSQYPRYLDGERVVYDTRGVSPGRLVNQYAVVDLADGRRLLKMLRRMPAPGRYRLESHNAAPEDDVDIVTAYPLMMVLPKSRT